MCLPGWRRFKSGCYQLSSTSNTWEFARQDCEGSGAHLVILTDKAEEVFVIYVHINFSCSLLSSKQNFVTEDTSDTCVCTWTWVDGSSLSGFDHLVKSSLESCFCSNKFRRISQHFKIFCQVFIYFFRYLN
uniref:C-type lectin domain-containing protein n=1 Tax=Amphilophus citrinellus TaxID=61819 RepID=A0A3Q0RBZ4_AMPCI